MVEFSYEPLFHLGDDRTRYRKVTGDHVALETFRGRDVLVVEPEALRLLAREAFHDIAFFLRESHIEKVAAILDDPEASANDRGVAAALLRNAAIAAEGVLPMCQDTGTATIVGWKGEDVVTGCDDKELLSQGVFETYKECNLRYSQNIPKSLFVEENSRTNLPAQIDLYAAKGASYRFLFVAKGGGSANKMQLFQETKAVLNPEALVSFLVGKMRKLGTAACPPYHVAFVVGGTSAETCLKTVKLASTGYLDGLPTEGGLGSLAFRDVAMEKRLLEEAYRIGLGAQFGGKYFALDVRLIRMPRHGASCPIGMAVSCSADRNALARIDSDGVWLEELERNPARFIPEAYRARRSHGAVAIDLNQPMEAIRKELTKHPVTTEVRLSGPMIVARDIAHAKLKERLDRGEGLPDYLKNHPVYYAGPAKTPEGMASGSFGPTTAQRMDPYVEPFQAAGGSLVMLAKGNRSRQVVDACKKHGGFYLGSMGGPAALIAKDHIKKVEVIEFPELGMEAVHRIEAEDFPAFILIDDKGNDFFAQVAG